jgi:hypothetical protein
LALASGSSVAQYRIGAAIGAGGMGEVYRPPRPGGRREPVVEIQPHDSSGVHGLETVSITPDGKSYAYQNTQWQSDLYLVDGLR